MSAPLYKDHQMPDGQEITGHKGLWFERFYDQYNENNWEILKPVHNDEDKGNSWWLNHYFHAKKVGNEQQLTRYALQQQKLAESLQGKSHIFKADWHMVTGMGNPHPVENGFAWHPTLGVPYLTGAAVKGLVRSYLENYLDATDKEKQDLLFNWFGSTNKDPQAEGYKTQTGNLIFFDALPIEPVQLVVDIMTPHMGDWYQSGAEKPNTPTTVPADWHEPVPVTFLATKGISLQFSYALRQYPKNTVNSSEPREAIDLDDVQKVLTSALEYLGVGGKTATGYGAMTQNSKLEEERKAEQEKQQEAQEKQQALDKAKQKMSPLAAEFFEQSQKGNWKEDKNAFWQMGVIENWIDKLEETPDIELKEMIEELMEKHFKGALANPEKTKGKKKKPVYKPRIQKIAKRLNVLKMA